MSDKTWDRMSGILIGVAIGFVAGVLLAPSNGAETRETLKKRTRGSLDQMAESVRDARDTLTKKGQELWRRGVTEIHVDDEQVLNGDDAGQGA